MLLVLGIASLGGLFTMYLYKEIAVAKSRVEYGVEFNTFINEINAGIGSDKCASILNLTPLTGSAQKMPLKYSSSAMRLLKVNSVYLTDITLAKMKNASLFFISTININVNKIGSNQMQDLALGVLYFKIDSLNQAMSCSNTPIAI